METYSVSVVIPTYNRATLLRRALKSALGSLRHDDEIIVVDDGSTDDTREVVAEYGNRLVYVQNQHGGAGKARNTGIDRATKPLIAFLDSDDEWMPGAFELKRRLLSARPDVVYCFSNFAVCFENEKKRRYLDRWHENHPLLTTSFSGPLNWDRLMGPAAKFLRLRRCRRETTIRSSTLETSTPRNSLAFTF